jgi:hypothetical protein
MNKKNLKTSRSDIFFIKNHKNIANADADAS